MRLEDRRELEALGLHVTPALLELAVHGAHRASMWWIDGEPSVLMGITPGDEPFEGHPWVLATPRIGRRKRALVGLSRPALDTLAHGYTLLSNQKDARNVAHIRWLQRLGFVFMARRDVGGLPFLDFARIIHE